MKKKTTKILLYLFGILFMLGGFLSIFSGVKNVIALKTAMYKQEVQSTVLSLKIENDWVDYTDLHTSQSMEMRKWITQEEMEINGKKEVMQLEYSTDPGGTPTHVLISQDGVHWTINDSDSQTVIMGAVAGIICIIFGGMLILFLRKHVTVQK